MRTSITILTLTLLVGVTLVQLGPAMSAPREPAATRIGPGLVPADARHPSVRFGAPLGGKVDPDTVYLMGGPSRTDGKFQSGSGGVLPDRQGWVGADRTIRSVAMWNVSTWNGRAQLDTNFYPNHVMWCGELFDAGCPGGDPPEGYANGYDEWLDWYGIVVNNTVPANVTVTCVLNVDTEPDYDVLRFEVTRLDGQDELARYSGDNRIIAFSQTFSVGVADYVGPGLNQIHLRFRATSDNGWSDGDCRWPTYGHSELDNILVTSDNGVNTYDNFEGGPAHWTVAFPPAVGDFSHVWPQLVDLDPCNSDLTPLFAFVDDGNVCPGTGGTPGLTWTYGPGGYVVNPNGGLAGPGYHLMNEIWSPPLAWPTSPTKQYSGMKFSFDLWSHLPLSNGIFSVWHVRSSTDGGVTWGAWRDRGQLNYNSSATWLRVGSTITDLLPPGRTHVQVALGAWDYGWVFGYHSDDVTPAPYFDSVQLLAYSYPGPAVSARDIDTFQDGFPASGTIDYANLGNNSVRLDMANDISPRMHFRNDPGDSMVASVGVVRAGAILQGYPQLHYKLHPNHLFDSYRTSGLPLAGSVNGDTTKTSAGAVIPNSWRWDFPDSNFFFPGDELHWYIEAQDNLAGEIGTSRMPQDTSGFSAFPGQPAYIPSQYASAFEVRALPTMHSATPGDQPHILLWNDSGGADGELAWYGALWSRGYKEKSDYDVYYTRDPAAGGGNGLGGRAAGPQLAGYTTILYTSGDLGNTTLSNGDSRMDAGNDVAVMTAWLSQGNKKWFCTGDDLAYDLGHSGAAALAFRNTFLPMVFDATDVRPLIQNQSSPAVDPVPGNPVSLSRTFIAYGACPTFNKFDAVEATTGSQRILTFRQSSGSAYPYAAALYVPNAGGYNDEVVYMPYDLQFIEPWNGQISDRSYILQDVLLHFGHVPGGSPGAIVEWANLVGPAAVSVMAGSPTPPIYGQARLTGGGGWTGLVAQLGYGPDCTSPLVNPDRWLWSPAAPHGVVGGNLEFTTTLTVPTGVYDYCYRYSYYGEPWVYGDLDGSTNGYSVAQAGALTVQGPAANAIFRQANFPSQPESAWGLVDYTFMGLPVLQYFNLVVNGVWQAVNEPLLTPPGRIGQPVVMSLNFDLGNGPGTNVPYLDYIASADLTPRTSAPTGEPLLAPVGDIDVTVGRIGQGEAPSNSPGGPGSVATVERWSTNMFFTNQDCGKNECCPAAYSNSLRSLDDANESLSIPEAIKNIEYLKGPTHWDSTGTPRDSTHFTGKREALQNFVTSRLFTMDQIDNVMSELDAGQDVELFSSHAAMVNGIWKYSNGEYKIYVAHDTQQGVKDGTLEQSLVYDSKVSRVTHGAFGFNEGSVLDYFVVECPLEIDPQTKYSLTDPGGARPSAYGWKNAERGTVPFPDAVDGRIWIGRENRWVAANIKEWTVELIGPASDKYGPGALQGYRNLVPPMRVPCAEITGITQKDGPPKKRIMTFVLKPQPDWETLEVIRIAAKAENEKADLQVRSYSHCSKVQLGERSLQLEDGWFGVPNDTVQINELFLFPERLPIDPGAPNLLTPPPESGTWSSQIVFTDPDGNSRPQGGLRWWTTGPGLGAEQTYGLTAFTVGGVDTAYSYYAFDGHSGAYEYFKFTRRTIVGVDDAPAIPRPFSVTSYPNPFNPTVRLVCHLPQDGRLRVRIYDVQGRLVRELIDADKTAGDHDVIWDGTDAKSRTVASGVYLYEVKALGERALGKITLAR